MLFSLVFVSSLGGIVLIFNVFMQAGLGFSPWHSALTTAPWAAGAFVGSGIGSVVMQKLGRRVLQTGLVIEAAGLIGCYGVLRGVGGHAGSLDLLAPMVVGGFGMGMVFVPLFDIVMAGVEPLEIGSASGVLQAINSLAMSLGVAGIGAIFFGLLGAGAGSVRTARNRAAAGAPARAGGLNSLRRRAERTAGRGVAGPSPIMGRAPSRRV